MPTNCSLFIKCVESSSILRYQDILPQIIDGKQFFIDGDSLLLFALTAKGLSLDKGGQTLHVVYLVEKFLLSFISRNLTFTVIFFEVSLADFSCGLCPYFFVPPLLVAC